MQQHGSKYSPPPPDPGRGVKNSTFSEHGQVEYQIKRNRECSNMQAHILPSLGLLFMKLVILFFFSSKCSLHLYIWASTQENLFLVLVNNRAADQSAHSPSLISAFVIHLHESI